MLFRSSNLKSLVERSNPDNMSDMEVDEMKAAKEKLMESAQAVFAKMYEQAQGAQGAGPDMGTSQGPDMGAGFSGASQDDIVDGDYKEV